MFVMFRRRHYNKALLVMLSLFLHWQENNPTMFKTIDEFLVAFDEYPVENFHSVLRRRTKETDRADQIANKAKEIDASKHLLHSFQSAFVPPRKFTYSRKSIKHLKEKAAEFLAMKFESLYSHPNMAVLQPRACRQNKNTSKWKLPNLFDGKIVTNQVLPLGYMYPERQPNPTSKCDIPGCQKENFLWNVFRGCGHSYHVECLLPDISVCPICRETLVKQVEVLGQTANNAVFSTADVDDNSDEEGEQTDDNDDDDDELPDCDQTQSFDIEHLLDKIRLWARNPGKR